MKFAKKESEKMKEQTDLYYHAKANLVPAINDGTLEKMAAQIRPLVRMANGRFRLVDIDGVDRRGVSFIWSPKLTRLVKVYEGGLNSIEIITFHTWGAPALFKPSLAEVYACINQYVPDWSRVKFFCLNSRALGHASIIGNYHWCRCWLFGGEQHRVIDDTWERDCAEILLQSSPG